MGVVRHVRSGLNSCRETNVDRMSGSRASTRDKFALHLRLHTRYVSINLTYYYYLRALNAQMLLHNFLSYSVLF